MLKGNNHKNKIIEGKTKTKPPRREPRMLFFEKFT